MSFSRTLPSLMGLGVSTSQEIGSGVTTAGAAVAAGASAGLLTAVGITAAAVPIIGPIVAGVALLINAFGIGNGCGGTCTEATQVVNQIEPLMQQNLTAAQQTVQQNGCLTSAELAQLESNFQSLWQQVLTGCGQIPAPGGTQCISDRQPGGKYDWTSYYLTPIQQMPVCAVPAASSSTAGSAVTGTTTIGGMTVSTPLLMGGALILAALLFSNK